jgi:tRNA modification GTPase
LLDLLADLEAGLDFVEDDIEFVARDDLITRLAAAAADLRQLADRAREELPAGVVPQVVLIGQPNAGKSTLLNALAGREAALVSEEAGTTRDWVSVDVEWEGVRLRLLDTAGWEQARDPWGVLLEASRREAMSAAVLALHCRSCEQWRALPAPVMSEPLAAGGALPQREVWTKADLRDEQQLRQLPGWCCSGLTGAGIEALRREVARWINERRETELELIATTAARCRESLRGTAAALQRACDAASASAGDELVALELREALDQLGQILGQVFTDDILDRVFSRFCIGK